jgi:hypothetical protein
MPVNQVKMTSPINFGNFYVHEIRKKMNTDYRRSQKLLFIIICELILITLTFLPTHAQSQDYFIFLPMVTKEDPCMLNSAEQEFANIMMNDPNQQRAFMQCDPILAKVARERAIDMGTRNYFNHVNPDGYGPNYLVQEAGYILPSYYNQSLTGNNIESICGGSSTASGAWNNMMGSDGHRTHLLGLIPFFSVQTDYGIGYAYIPNSTYGHYWVIITAINGP